MRNLIRYRMIIYQGWRVLTKLTGFLQNLSYAGQRMEGQSQGLVKKRAQRNLTKVWSGRIFVSTHKLFSLPPLYSHPTSPNHTTYKSQVSTFLSQSSLRLSRFPHYWKTQCVAENTMCCWKTPVSGVLESLRTQGSASQLANVFLTHSCLWLLGSIYSLMKESRPSPLWETSFPFVENISDRPAGSICSPHPQEQ